MLESTGASVQSALPLMVRPVVPSAALLPTRILPALRTVPSAYVLAPPRVSVSLPFFVMPPLLTTPAKPTLESFSMTRIEPLRSVPPVKMMAPV